MFGTAIISKQTKKIKLYQKKKWQHGYLWFLWLKPKKNIINLQCNSSWKQVFCVCMFGKYVQEKLLLSTGRRRCSLWFSVLVLWGIATCWLPGFTRHILIETVIQFLWKKDMREGQKDYEKNRTNNKEKTILVITTRNDLHGISKRNKDIFPLIQ